MSAAPESRSGFNASAWAVAHQPLVLFFILALAIGGAISYLRLGQAEDPSFTIKVAVITAIWPGATAREMQDQVADRIEKKLQELPYFDKVQTYTKPGFTAMQMAFKDHDAAGATCPSCSIRCARSSATCAPNCPRGSSVPERQRRVRRCRRAPLHAHRRWRRLRQPQARMPSYAAAACCACPTSPR
jgi:hypothetical protein